MKTVLEMSLGFLEVVNLEIYLSLVEEVSDMIYYVNYYYYYYLHPRDAYENCIFLPLVLMKSF